MSWIPVYGWRTVLPDQRVGTQLGMPAKCPCTRLATKNATAIAAMIQAVRRARAFRCASSSGAGFSFNGMFSCVRSMLSCNSNGAAFVENKAMDGRGSVAIADDCSRIVVSSCSNQGRLHKSMADVSMRQLGIVDHRRHREAVVRGRRRQRPFESVGVFPHPRGGFLLREEDAVDHHAHEDQLGR